MRRPFVLALTFALAGLAASLGAQAVVTGSAVDDSTGRALAAVEVLLEGTKRQTTTDPSGRFVLDGLPSGTRVILFRAIGFRPVRVRVTLGKADTVRADARLVSDRVQLEPIEVTGRPSAPRGIGLEAFEERRRLGFGKFIDSTELRRADNRRLGDVLARIPGLKVMQFREQLPGGTPGPLELRVASSRKSGLGVEGPCWMSVVLDGVFIYRSESSGRPPDFLREFSASGMQAVEVYRSEAETPLEFGGATAACGTVVMWSRRRQ